MKNETVTGKKPQLIFVVVLKDGRSIYAEKDAIVTFDSAEFFAPLKTVCNDTGMNILDFITLFKAETPDLYVAEKFVTTENAKITVKIYNGYKFPEDEIIG
ncbi:MAG: hypothetical protein ACRC92_26135 [Peptostreptococcaceae bacterium]